MSEYVYTCLEMFCPPLVGMLRCAFPYVTLNNLEFLDVNGYIGNLLSNHKNIISFIAATNNQLFETRSSWYDLCCQIEFDGCKIKLSKDKYTDLDYDKQVRVYRIYRFTGIHSS